MRRLASALIAIFLFTVSAQAQEFHRYWAIEAGVGMAPLHTALFYKPSWNKQTEYAQAGQEVYAQNNILQTPAVSIAAVWRYSPHWEHEFAASLSWLKYGVTQYSEFGTDPYGQPRYDLDTGVLADEYYVFIPAFNWQARYIFNPGKKFQVYEALGVGIFAGSNDYLPYVFPVPTFTLLAFRYCGNHIYGFTELLSYNAKSFLAQGGVGWKF